MLLARTSCSLPALPSFSPTLLLSIVFVAVKKEGGIGAGAVPVMSGVISAINCFVAASSAAFRVAIRSNIAKDTEYIY